MVSLGPEDYGMPPDERFPLKTFFVLVLLAIAIFGYAFYWANKHPEEIEAAQAERVNNCDPRARKIDTRGKPYCDPVVDAMMNGRW